MSAAQNELNRGQFMLGPGNLLLNSVGSDIFPKLFLKDAPIGIPYSEDPGYLASLIGEKFVSNITLGGDIARMLLNPTDGLEPSDAVKEKTEELHKTIGRHTFTGSLAENLKEGLQASVHFPINILRLADVQLQREQCRPLFKTFKDFTAALRAPWFFEQVCKPAANTANEFWLGLSNEHQASIRETVVVNFPYNPFVFQSNDDSVGQTFGFSKVTLQKIHNHMRARNQQARSGSALVNARNTGISSGCPVVHKPSIKAEDPRTMQFRSAIEYMAGKEAVEKALEIDESLIKTSLPLLADMLERSYALSKPL